MKTQFCLDSFDELKKNIVFTGAFVLIILQITFISTDDDIHNDTLYVYYE